MDLAIFYDCLSPIEPPCGPFWLENFRAQLLLATSWLTTIPTLHPYISAFDVDKNYLKQWETQLAMHSGEGSLIDLSYVVNCKPAALGLLEIIRFEIFSCIFLDNYPCV